MKKYQSILCLTALLAEAAFAFPVCDGITHAGYFNKNGGGGCAPQSIKGFVRQISATQASINGFDFTGICTDVKATINVTCNGQTLNVGASAGNAMYTRGDLPIVVNLTVTDSTGKHTQKSNMKGDFEMMDHLGDGTLDFKVPGAFGVPSAQYRIGFFGPVGGANIACPSSAASSVPTPSGISK